MKSTPVANTQEGTSKDLTQEPIVPNQQMALQIGSSSQGPQNNLANFPIQQNDLSSLLEAILDESDIEESTMRSTNNILANQLGPHAINVREQNNGGENDQRQHGGQNKTIGSTSSVFRGVIKCHDRRFEAFARDNSVERGRIVYIGSFSNEVDAARAHDMVALKISGLHTLINFPGRCYWKEIDFMRNMRKKDYIENVRGRGKENNPESEYPFRGVYRAPELRKWGAKLGRKGMPTINLGFYYTQEDAARAYDIVSIKLKGWKAITNFDITSYEVKNIMECAVIQDADGSVVLDKPENNNEIEVYPQINSLVQHNVPQQLSNSSSSHGFQNPVLIPSSSGFQPYPQSSNLGQHNSLGGFTLGAGSSSGNSIANLGRGFPNQNATLQHSLQTQNQLNLINNYFFQNLLNNNTTNNNNQFLPMSSTSNLPFHADVNQNLGLENRFRFPNFPFDFGKTLLGEDTEFQPLSTLSDMFEQSALATGMMNGSTGATNVASSSVSEIEPVPPSTQDFEAAQPQLPELNQIYEPYNFQANTLNQNPHQNLNSFYDGFQNPSSQPNNTGSQSHATHGGQIELGMTDLLNNDFSCDDFDFFIQQ